MIEDKLKKTAIFTGIFVALSLSIMFYRAATKSVMIAEAGDAYKTNVGDIRQYNLRFDKPDKDSEEGVLVIPLESGVTSDNIQFVEKHARHQFVLYINGKTPDFYSNNSVISDLECIESGTYAPLNDKGMVCLTFELDGLYQNETSLGDGEITVSFDKPDYESENVVVIDPVDEIGVQMIPYIKTALGNDDIILYFTTLDDHLAGDEEVMGLIKDSQADFYIQLGIDDTRESDSGIRTYYNDRFFIRGFGNVQLADKLEMNLAKAAECNALGLAAADESNQKLSYSVVPSAFATIGNINNRVDLERLGKDSYIEKCAEGLAEGIRTSFSINSPIADEPESDGK